MDRAPRSSENLMCEGQRNQRAIYSVRFVADRALTCVLATNNRRARLQACDKTRDRRAAFVLGSPDVPRIGRDFCLLARLQGVVGFGAAFEVHPVDLEGGSSGVLENDLGRL